MGPAMASFPRCCNRLHDLEGCDDDDRVHLLCRKALARCARRHLYSFHPRPLRRRRRRHRRHSCIERSEHTALLRAHASESATAQRSSQLRKGWSVTEIQRVAQRWQSRADRSVVRHRSARSSAGISRRQPEQASRQQPTTDRVVVR